MTAAAKQPNATNHARLRHRCGQYVYTERNGNAPPAFPRMCRYCGKAV